MTVSRVVDRYELSPTQEGMLFHGLQGETTGVDVEQVVCSIAGPFDADAFAATLRSTGYPHPEWFQVETAAAAAEDYEQMAREQAAGS